MRKEKLLPGQHIGNVTLLHCHSVEMITATYIHWTCRCDCGQFTQIPSAVLGRSKTIKACNTCKTQILHSQQRWHQRLTKSFGVLSVSPVAIRRDGEDIA